MGHKIMSHPTSRLVFFFFWMEGVSYLVICWFFMERREYNRFSFSPTVSCDHSETLPFSSISPCHFQLVAATSLQVVVVSWVQDWQSGHRTDISGFFFRKTLVNRQNKIESWIDFVKTRKTVWFFLKKMNRILSGLSYWTDPTSFRWNWEPINCCAWCVRARMILGSAAWLGMGWWCRLRGILLRFVFCFVPLFFQWMAVSLPKRLWILIGNLG